MNDKHGKHPFTKGKYPLTPRKVNLCFCFLKLTDKSLETSLNI